jgi:hypothetical protein
MYKPVEEQTEEEFPFEGSRTSPMYPPVCLKTHWDPTQMLRHIIPNQQVSVPLSFRPYSKVCLEYKTSAPAEGLPYTPDNLVFPPGSDYYPPSRYIEAISSESKLRRLDRPLGTCEKDQYLPALHGDMYNPGIMAPKRQFGESSRMIQELAMPQVLLHGGPYNCRRDADYVNIAASGKFFNNATKLAKYGTGNKPQADKRTH